MARATLFLDSECGVCTRAARTIRRLDTDNRIDLRPIRSSAADGLAGLGEELRYGSWHLQRPDGSLVSEGDVLPELLKLLPRLAPLGRVIAWVPAPLRNGVYRFVARRRHRISRALHLKACQLDGGRSSRESR